MYVQVSYIDGDFWKISGSGSGFVKTNLALGIIYIVSKPLPNYIEFDL